MLGKVAHVEKVLGVTNSASAAARSRLAASWRRSADKHGLDPAENRGPERIDSSHLRERLEVLFEERIQPPLTIAELDGNMSGLQVKPGKGVDLRQFGRADIKRASDITWDEDAQAWTVVCKVGKYAGHAMTNREYHTACKAMGNEFDCHLIGQPEHDAAPAQFDDYDEAVTGEIDWLNHIRLTEGPEVLA